MKSIVTGEFPGLSGRTFLDAACVSLMPQRAHEAIVEFSARLVAPTARDGSEHHIWMDELREQTIPRVATMLGCPDECIALIESTSHGLNIAARAIDWRDGDEIVMCDLEYLQVAIPFVKLAERTGVRTVFVHHEAGVADVDCFRRAVSPATRAIVVSSTQWSNGYRIALPELAELARSVGAWLIVDAVQQAGAVPLELDGVDFLIAGGHKWLNAPMGCGFMALSRRVLDELEPASFGYMALEPGEGGWIRYFSTPDITPDRRYDFVPGAKRFEIGGTGNYPGAIVLGKSVELVNEIGIDAAAERIWALGDRLIEGLERLDVRLETPFGRDHRAGIISFTLGDRDRDRACLEHLLGQKISVSQRYTARAGGIRASVHYFNSTDDVDHLLAETAAHLRRAPS